MATWRRPSIFLGTSGVPLGLFDALQPPPHRQRNRERDERRFSIPGTRGLAATAQILQETFHRSWENIQLYKIPFPRRINSFPSPLCFTNFIVNSRGNVVETYAASDISGWKSQYRAEQRLERWFVVSRCSYNLLVDARCSAFNFCQYGSVSQNVLKFHRHGKPRLSLYLDCISRSKFWNKFEDVFRDYLSIIFTKITEVFNR